ncbi:TonB-dependent receptor [Altererythrobacter sp. ZODW24]|uniref:TonB-dependent receptor n=1 Tax=Altererythrobacter sp. ZODW24 TaxID=2185142 RepID=UPI000DF7C1E5|nr:TonB-dependent receptor [Altererythrobacter sp. ZODW24]
MTRIGRIRTLLASGAAIAAITLSAPAMAQQREFSVPAQSATTAIPEFARQAGVQIIAPGSVLRGVNTRTVEGEADVREALRLMLRDTRLKILSYQNGVITLGGPATAPAASVTFRANAQADGRTIQLESGQSVLTGQVTDVGTGQPLAGAIVRLQGTNRVTTTDSVGEYRFVGLPERSYTVVVQYLGAPDAVRTVSVGASSEVTLAIPVTLSEQEILVLGPRSAQQRALNQQRSASNNSTVVSADLLGGFPAETISEALRRVPGVGFGRDDETGEGSRITVRGFSSEAINVQLNGIEQQGTSFSRTVDLSGFLTENLSEVTIHKSLLPSHEATGSGGLVEIETKSALDYGDFSLNLNVEGEFSPDRDFGEEYQLNGTLSKKLSPTFGVVATLQYRRTNRTNVDSAVTDIIPPVLPAGVTFSSRIPASTVFPFDPELPAQLITGVNFVQRDRVTEAYSGSLGFAWDVADHTRLRLDLQRNVNDTVGVTTNNSFILSTPAVNMPIAELGGEVRRRETLSALNSNYSINTFDNKLTSDTISFRGDTKVGRWEFEYRLGYAYAKEEGDNALLNLRGSLISDLAGIFDPAAIVTAPDTNGNLRVIDGLFAPGANGIPIPSLSAAGEAAIIDPNQFDILIASRNLIDNTTESFNAEFQARYKPAADFLDYIEIGALYRPTKRNTIDDATNPRTANIESYVRRFGQEISIGEIDGALLGSRSLDVIGLPTFQVASIDPDVLPAAFDAIRAAGDARFFVNDNRGVDPFLNSGAFQPTETTEDKFAGYLETHWRTGRFDLVAGVRYENEKRSNTTISSPSIQFANGAAGSEPRETFLNAGLISFDDVSGTVDTWTPSFLLNYRPADNIVARLGYFRSTVNPDLRLLNRTQRIRADLRPNIGLVTLSIPNPDLKPTVTDNLDLDLAYYFADSIGLIRAGFFYKSVKNNFTNVIFENGDGSGVQAAYEEFFSAFADTRPDFFEYPDGTEFVLNQPVNGEGGEIYGAEFEIIRKLDFLPGFLSDFGVLANATYTTADFPTLESARDDDGNLIQLSLDRPLRDQPKWVYNLSLDYSKNGFDALVIYTHQSATAEDFDEFNINTVIPSYDTLDARLSYNFKRAGGLFTVYLEGDNLLQGGKDPEVRQVTSSQFGDGAASFSYPQRYQFNGGRTLTLGVRARF